MIQRHLFVSGKVQGVFFRQSTQAEARRRSGIKGFVKNLSDGRVEALFVGAPEPVFELVAWCRKGPPGANVHSLEVIEEAVGQEWEAENGFSIRY